MSEKKQYSKATVSKMLGITHKTTDYLVEKGYIQLSENKVDADEVLKRMSDTLLAYSKIVKEYNNPSMSRCRCGCGTTTTEGKFYATGHNMVVESALRTALRILSDRDIFDLTTQIMKDWQIKIYE